jgi:hypothetical protein
MLIRSSSEEFGIYLNYVRKLGFEEAPDYEFLRELFVKILKNNGDVEDGIYDWNLLNGISKLALTCDHLLTNCPQAAVAGKHLWFVFILWQSHKCLIRSTSTRVHKRKVRPLPLIAGEIHAMTAEDHKVVPTWFHPRQRLSDMVQNNARFQQHSPLVPEVRLHLGPTLLKLTFQSPPSALVRIIHMLTQALLTMMLSPNHTTAALLP